MKMVMAMVGVLFLVAVVGGLALHRQLWGRAQSKTEWTFWLMLAAGIVAHEGLHGLAMVFCGVPPRQVRFGVSLSRGAAFATTTAQLSIGQYRFVLVLPLVALGLAPFAVGLACGHVLVAKLGAIMVAGAGGDVAVLLALRGVPPGARVVDHPSEPGCYLLPM
jgi:hypothetical protein